MKQAVLILILIISGCAGLKHIDMPRNDIMTAYQGEDQYSGTYSDYGNQIALDNESGLYKYTVSFRGYGRCEGVMLRYAKKKMDAFMVKNDFTDYIVKSIEQQLLSSKCILNIEYLK